MHVSLRSGLVRPGMLALMLALMLVLTACGGDDADPTVEPSPTQEAAAEPTATPEPEPEPTETATPEPTPSPTPYSPPPTVSAPLHIPPAAPPVASPVDEADPTPTVVELEPTPEGQEPAPTPVEQATEPTPDTSLPEEDDEITGLLYASDLTDIPGWENELGAGFVAEDGFHITNIATDGSEVWDVSSAHLEFGNIVAMIDVRNVSEAAASAACLAVRTSATGWDHAYTVCITGAQESFADFKYVDVDGIYRYEELVEISVREGTFPSTEWNTLMIVASGQDLGFFVNDELIGVAIHPSIEVGGVAFNVGNYSENPAEWVFTNLQVWEITE